MFGSLSVAHCIRSHSAAFSQTLIVPDESKNGNDESEVKVVEEYPPQLMGVLEEGDTIPLGPISLCSGGVVREGAGARDVAGADERAVLVYALRILGPFNDVPGHHKCT